MKRELSVTDLRDRVLLELRKTGFQTTIEHLRQSVGYATPTYLVGGFVRDCARALFEDRCIETKDLDVVVETSRLREALELLPGERHVTPLGGYRLWPPSTVGWVDLWQLADTVWIARLNLAPTIANFLAGVDLNVDRIALGLHDHVVRDSGCLRAIATKTIDLDADVAVGDLFPAELGRAVIAHLKTGYPLAERVVEQIRARISDVLSVAVLERLRGDGYGDEMLDRLTTFLQMVRREEHSQAKVGDSHDRVGQH